MYEIWDTTINEILVDNLSFEQAVEQVKTYQDLFGSSTIVVALRQRQHKPTIHTTPAQQYKNAWIDYFAELQSMGNLY